MVCACYSEEDAKEKLEEWRNEHSQADHLCYAYRLGVEKEMFRHNDDGEPSNSAGAPIFGQIQSFDLTNILIGVLRYYGGTKLGVGGLINAYRTAAKDAIENGTIVEKELSQRFNVSFDYADMPHVMHIFKENNIQITEQNFETECWLNVEIPRSELSVFKQITANFNSLQLKKIK